MSSVVVEGTLTPAVGLPGRGERRLVRYTDRIERLVRNGHLKIVDYRDTVAQPAEEPAELTDSEIEADKNAAGDGPDDDGVPARNASTEIWRTFVEENIPGVVIPEDTDRKALMAAWDAYVQQRDGGQ